MTSDKKIASAILSGIYVCFMLFLWFKVLEFIQATELIWFIYWMIVPFTIIVVVIQKLIDD